MVMCVSQFYLKILHSMYELLFESISLSLIWDKALLSTEDSKKKALLYPIHLTQYSDISAYNTGSRRSLCTWCPFYFGVYIHMINQIPVAMCKYFRISLARGKINGGKWSLLLISWCAPDKILYQSLLKVWLQVLYYPFSSCLITIWRC